MTGGIEFVAAPSNITVTIVAHHRHRIATVTITVAA